MISHTDSSPQGRGEPSGFSLPAAATTVAFVFGLAIAVAFLIPGQALASSGGHTVPVAILGLPGPSDVAGWFTDQASNAAQAAGGVILDGFLSILNFLLGGFGAGLTVAIVRWLTIIPDFSGGQISVFVHYTQAAAGAMLGCVLTLSIIRFWIGSFANGSSSEGVTAGMQGVARVCVAALLIALWPQLFKMAVDMGNALAGTILTTGVHHQLKGLFGGFALNDLAGDDGPGDLLKSISASGGAVLMWILVMVAAQALVIALMIMKIMVTVGTILVFVFMPLALIVWPLPEMDWIAKALGKVLMVLIALPLVWVLIFGAAAAMTGDFFNVSNNASNSTGWLGTGLDVLILKPVMAVALLYLAVVLPSKLIKMAGMMGGGFAGRRATMAMGSGGGAASMGGGMGAGANGAMGPAGRNGSTSAMGAGAAAGGSAGTGIVGRMRESKAGQAVGGQVSKAQNSKLGQAAGGARNGSIGKFASAPAGAAVNGAKAIPKASNALSEHSTGTSFGSMREKALAGGAMTAAALRGSDPKSIGKFESAPERMRDKTTGGPIEPNHTPEFNARVQARHQRMTSMDASERPSKSQVADSWNQINTNSPGAGKAIEEQSNKNSKGHPHALAQWSETTGNPHWSPDAQKATQTLGEASPETRQEVIRESRAAEQKPQNGGSPGPSSSRGGGSSSAPAAKPAAPANSESTRGIPAPRNREVSA